MTDATNLDKLASGGAWTTLGVVLALVGSFLKPLVTGAGPQEKDLRDSLATRVDKLELRISALETENEKYRQEIIVHEKRFLWFFRDRERIRTQRDSLRGEVETLRRQCGHAHAPWPEDPADPLTF